LSGNGFGDILPPGRQITHPHHAPIEKASPGNVFGEAVGFSSCAGDFFMLGAMRVARAAGA